MKLILANNQSDRFVLFYEDLKQQSETPFDYSGYLDLVFVFDSMSQNPVKVYNTATNRALDDYDGVYINGYLNTYELAAAVAICCDALGVPYQNKEMQNPPSLSKLSMYAKLAAAKVSIPKSVVGSKKSIINSRELSETVGFPAVFKRADADRGIDNYKIDSFDDVVELLDKYAEDSIWVIQEYIENTGYYLTAFYDNQPKFCIYRKMQNRPDGYTRKSHMYKPKGGANARLVNLDEVEPSVMSECLNAVKAMNRQIGSVDCIYDSNTGKTYVLEVNYNPQFVTIETLKDVRTEAFLSHLKNLK